MTVPWLAAVLTALTGLGVALLTAPVLNHLPEPSDAGAKPPYRDLASLRFVLACVLLAILAQALALHLLPMRVQPLWTVLALCAVLLAAIDARTTWLPLPLTRVAWLLMVLAVGISLLLGATLADGARAAAGAALAGALYFLIWAATKGGFGFGDVRFAPLLGAATGSYSWTLLLWSLTLGSVVGALHGVVRMIRRQPGSFPYAPSMLAGCYLAAVLLPLVVGPGP